MTTRWTLPYLVAVGILFGPAYVAYQHFDPGDPRGLNDAGSYLPMAAGRLAEADTLHTYRVLVPMAAGATGRAIGAVAGPAEDDAEGWKRLRIGFLVVNLALVALAVTFAYRLGLAYGVSTVAAAAAAVVFATSRHTVYIAGTPVVDSLYLAAIGATFYAVRTRRFWLLAVAVPVGLLAKEAYLLFLPIALVWGPSTWWRRIAAAVAGIVLVVVVREALALYASAPQALNLSEALGHLWRVPATLGYLATPVAWVKLALVFNLFTLVPVAALAWAPARRRLGHVDRPLLLAVPVALLHMLLSGNVERMALVAFPAFCVALALFLDAAREAPAPDEAGGR